MRPCVTAPIRIRETEFGGAKPLFCVPLVAGNLPDLIAQSAVAHQLHADLVEWRADSYVDFSVDAIVEAARALRRSLPEEPILFTPRVHSEGGAREIAEDTRWHCIEAVLQSDAVDLVDIELSNGSEIVERVVRTAHSRSRHVIISFHDFQDTPTHDVLFEKISKMVSFHADIAKIACMPRNPQDVLRLLQLTLTARESFPRVPLCMISMSALGLVSRLTGFLYGNDMTFAAGAASSAPGQISITEARKITDLLLRGV